MPDPHPCFYQLSKYFSGILPVFPDAAAAVARELLQNPLLARRAPRPRDHAPVHCKGTSGSGLDPDPCRGKTDPVLT